MANLGGAQQAAINTAQAMTAQAMTAQGTKINYIRSTFAPEDGR